LTSTAAAAVMFRDVAQQQKQEFGWQPVSLLSAGDLQTMQRPALADLGQARIASA